MIARPRLRQLGLGELLDESFKLFRSNFIAFVAMTALVMVPYQIINYLIQLPFQDAVAGLAPQLQGQNPFATQTPFELFGGLVFWYLGLIGVALLYAVLFQPLLEGALTHAISERFLGNPSSVGASFGAGLRRIPALVGARLIPVLLGSVLFGAIIAIFALGLLALSRNLVDGSGSSTASIVALGSAGVLLLLGLSVIAGLLFIRILFTAQCIMVEGLGPWQSIKRSWNLTGGYFWRTLGYVIVIGLLVFVLTALPTALFSAPIGLLGLDRRLQLLLTTIVSTLVTVVATPFSLITYTLMYFDLRIRKEGYDIEQQGRALREAHPASSYAQSS